VPAELDVLFDVDGRVFEGVFGFRLRLTETGSKRDVVVRHAHPASATTGGGL
jgi:hypothetical protein